MKIVYPSDVMDIARILNQHGHSAYAVGGCIRDSVMQRSPQDWDITTDASPDEMIGIFTGCGIRTLPTGIKHGTVSIILNGRIYECTTFRIDGEYTDSRHPDTVTFTSELYEDLRRRDFTVNAMAGDPLSESSEIVDEFGGMSDIEKKIIKCVGDPYKRFCEDSLRILRAVRFATILGFDIEDNTKIAAKATASRLLMVSAERKRTELEKIILSENADRGVKLLIDMDIAKYIYANMSYPPVQLGCLSGVFGVRLAALAIGSANLDEKHKEMLADGHRNSEAEFGSCVKVKNCAFDDKCRGSLKVKNSELGSKCGDSPKVKSGEFDGKCRDGSGNTADGRAADSRLDLEKNSDVCRESLPTLSDMKLSVAEMKQVRLLCNNALFCGEVSEKNARRMLSAYGELAHDAALLRGAYSLAELISNESLKDPAVRISDLDINGNDLKNVGVKPRDIGVIMNRLLCAVIDDPSLNKREVLISLALSYSE